MTRVKSLPTASARAKTSDKRRQANKESAKRSRENKATGYQGLLKGLHEARCRSNELLRDLRQRGVAIKVTSMEHRIQETVRKLRPFLTSPKSSFVDGELERMTEDVLLSPKLKGIILSSENAKI